MHTRSPFLLFLTLTIILILSTTPSSSSAITTTTTTTTSQPSSLIPQSTPLPFFPLSSPELQQACATATSCDACYLISGCHFCDNDNKCHVYGSIYGCLAGASCPKPECIRKTPQHVGYQRVSPVIIVGILLAFLLIFIGLIVLLHFVCFGCLYVRKCFGYDNQSMQQGTTVDEVSSDDVFLVPAGSNLNDLSSSEVREAYSAPSIPTLPQTNTQTNGSSNTRRISSSSRLLSNPTIQSDHSSTSTSTRLYSTNQPHHSTNLSELEIAEANDEQQAQFIPKRSNRRR